MRAAVRARKKKVVVGLRLLTSVDLLLAMMNSQGLRNCFWKLKVDSSSFSRNFMASCLSESMEYIEMLRF